jgi:hypothetical protein
LEAATYSLGQPPELIAQLVCGVLIEKVEEPVAYVPPLQTIADLRLGDENDAGMRPASRTPLLVDETKVALRVAIVAGDHHASLTRRLSQDRAIIPLHLDWQGPRLNHLVSVCADRGGKLCRDHYVAQKRRE